MTKRNRNILLILILLLVGVLGGTIFLLNLFLSSFQPAKITVTHTQIRSSDGFVNPVTIERLRVDSIGAGNWPVKYIIEYLTTCAIRQEDGKPPVALKIIKLNEPGRYTWSEEIVKIPMVHSGLSRVRTDSAQDIIWSHGHNKLDVCPIKFEAGNWYFITFLDPQIVGVFVYVEKNSVLRQKIIYSGVSPI